MNRYSDPLVSVCIPVYNNEKYIARTLESVASQTYQNIEIIVVDDNSSDNSLMQIENTVTKLKESGKIQNKCDLSKNKIVYTKEVVKELSGTARQIDFFASNIPELDSFSSKTVYIFHNDKNLGMAGNWNRCMELCRGEYIKLICADDQIHPSLIEKEVAIMKEYPEVVLVESDTVFVDDANRKCGKYPRYGKGLVDGKEIAEKSILRRDYFGAPLANLVRAISYKKYGGFDPEFSYIVDYDFFMKLACHGKIYVIREPLNYFCIRNDSNTGEVLGGSKRKTYTEEHIKLVNKYSQELKLSRVKKTASVLNRKIMNLLGGIYLQIKLR